MIITVTFNPAIDKTAEVDTLHVGGLNRLCNVRMDAGGKGVNVSKTIQALGGKTLCTGFLAGNSGEYIQSILQDMQIESDFVWVEGATRTNLKVLDDQRELTELNEAGPYIQGEQIQALMDKILSLCDETTLVVLSGNVSPGVEKSIYRDMIYKIKEKKASVILDADGELFKEGIQAHPMIIKPNKYELALHFGMDKNFTNQDIIQKAKGLLNEETKLVVVSMGGEGSIFLSKDGVYLANALSIQAHSSVGAGDAMVAAIAYASEQGYALEDLIRLAVATSAGAVMTEGTNPASKEVVENLMKQVQITKVED
ncbi:1-phosphofructokinase [Amedibacillus sp. YH-ame6]